MYPVYHWIKLKKDKNVGTKPCRKSRFGAGFLGRKKRYQNRAKREKFGNRILIQFTTQKSCLNVVHFYYIYLIKPAKGSKFTTIWMRPNHNWISVFGVIVHRCLESSSCQWPLYHWQMVACDLLGWFCILRHQWSHQPWLWDQLCPLKNMQKWKKNR